MISLYGSGVYSIDVDIEMECMCGDEDCITDKEPDGCGNVWEESFQTNDYGNIDTQVHCPKCQHSFSFSREYD